VIRVPSGAPHILSSQPVASSVIRVQRSATQALSTQPISGTQWFGRPFSLPPPLVFPANGFLFPGQDIFFFDRFHHHHFFFSGAFGFPSFCGFGGFGPCFFQPFFGPRFFSPFFFPSFFPFLPFDGGVRVIDAGVSGGEGPPNEPSPTEATEAGDSLEALPSSPAQPAAPAKLAVLVLKDGWTYEVTDYWVENGQLRYVTSYGGENAVPLEAIDFDQTAQQNWERGVEFVLRPKPKAR